MLRSYHVTLRSRGILNKFFDTFKPVHVREIINREKDELTNFTNPLLPNRDNLL